MKTLTAILVALTFASTAIADDAETKVIGNKALKAAENNVYSQLCLAAVESKYVAQRRAEELGVQPSRLRQIECNGMAIWQFAEKYEQNRIVTAATPKPGS